MENVIAIVGGAILAAITVYLVEKSRKNSAVSDNSKGKEVNPE